MNICINQVNMTSVGGVRIKPAPTPKMREYPEGYFMQKSPLAKDYVPPKSPLKKLLEKIKKIFK